MAKKFSDMAPYADYSPNAQRLRRERLTPDAIAHQLRREGLGGEFECLSRAVDLVRLTRYLRCSPAERERLVDRILDLLDEVEEERSRI